MKLKTNKYNTKVDPNSEMKVGEVMKEPDRMTKDPYQMVENIADLTVDHVRRHLSLRLVHKQISSLKLFGIIYQQCCSFQPVLTRILKSYLSVT